MPRALNCFGQLLAISIKDPANLLFYASMEVLEIYKQIWGYTIYCNMLTQSLYILPLLLLILG